MLRTFTKLGEHVLRARHEGEFLEQCAAALREHVQCDAVIVRLLERHIQTRVVATKDGVHVLPPDELWEPFTDEDRQLWLECTDGIFVENIADDRHVKPNFRRHALSLGLKSGFMLPVVRDGESIGQLVFAWSSPTVLDEVRKNQLRVLTEFACLQFTLFNMRKAYELDGLTGLLNRLGLRRRWELVSQSSYGALLYVDVTGLKSVGNSQGHLAVEDVLRQIGRLLTQEMRPGVTVGRYGENQFVLLAPGANQKEADDIKRAFGQRFRRWRGTVAAPHPRCSVGAAYWPGDGTEFSALVGQAERRILEQKRRHVRRWSTAAATAGHDRAGNRTVNDWLTSSLDGVVVTDEDGTVLYVNPAYERLTGYSGEEWLGKNVGFVASGLTPPAVYDDMWQQLEMTGSWRGTVVNRHRLGSEWISSITITRLSDETGRTAGFIGVARDATDYWAKEHRLPPISFEQMVTQQGLVFALAEAAQRHAGGTMVHLERVRRLTRLLATSAAAYCYPRLRSSAYQSTVVLASVLHDVGNLRIPAELLSKSGPLSKDEYELVKTHAEAGRHLLRSRLVGTVPFLNSFFLQTAANIAASHHERWDGSGYPYGLEGQDIPLEARIVTIVDVYDKLRSDRPYRSAWSHTEAADYIEGQAGRRFDPLLVELFTSLRDEFDRTWRGVGEDGTDGGGDSRRAS